MIDPSAVLESAYLDSKTAARYMGFHTVRTFRQWARRMRIKAKRRSPGRVLLWRQSDLDATIQDDDWTPGQDQPVAAPDPPPRRGRPSTRRRQN